MTGTDEYSWPFFLYDGQMKLAYCGQFDASRPGLGHPPMEGTETWRTSLSVTGEDMRRAADAVLAGQPTPQPQVPGAVLFGSDGQPSLQSAVPSPSVSVRMTMDPVGLASPRAS